MNERIKQLLGQAYDEAVPETWTTLSSEQLERVYEKFAKLIVNECILTIQMGITRDGHNTEKYLRSMKHLKDIKEHFGVEE